MEWKDRLLFAYDLQWFAKDGPGGEKTEPATEKKLREAREDGKVAKLMRWNHLQRRLLRFYIMCI